MSPGAPAGHTDMQTAAGAAAPAAAVLPPNPSSDDRGNDVEWTAAPGKEAGPACNSGFNWDAESRRMLMMMVRSVLGVLGDGRIGGASDVVVTRW